MSEYEFIIDYVKSFYSFTIAKNYDNKIIYIHDSLEQPKTKKVYWVGVIFGVEIYFVWDKAEEITKINIEKRENYRILSFLCKCLKCSQTMSFIKFVIDSIDKNNKTYTFCLNEIQEEIPLIFDKGIEVI